jgi:hypothetical protein
MRGKGKSKKFAWTKSTSRLEESNWVRKTTKNRTARYLPIYGDMAAEISMSMSLAGPDCPFLVQAKGERVND